MCVAFGISDTISAATPDLDILHWNYFFSKQFQMLQKSCISSQIKFCQKLGSSGKFSSRVSSSLHSQKQLQLCNRAYKIISDWIIKCVPVIVWLFDGVWARVCAWLHVSMCLCVWVMEDFWKDSTVWICLSVVACRLKLLSDPKPPTGTRKGSLVNGNKRRESHLFSLHFARTNSYR